MKWIKRIKKWYKGKYILPKRESFATVTTADGRRGHGVPINEPIGHWEQPPLANLLRRLGQFWREQWKWIIGTAIAVTAIFISL